MSYTHPHAVALTDEPIERTFLDWQCTTGLIFLVLQVYIAAPEVLMLFSDNFDYQVRAQAVPLSPPVLLHRKVLD